MTMPASDLAFCFIALVVCLAASLIRALHEIEVWRERRRHRDALTRAAMRTVVPIGQRRR